MPMWSSKAYYVISTMVFYTNNESKIELNALVVRVRSLPGVKSRHQNIDTVIIRFVN